MKSIVRTIFLISIFIFGLLFFKNQRVFACNYGVDDCGGGCNYCATYGRCVHDMHCESSNIKATEAKQSQQDSDTCNDICHYACSNTYKCGSGANCSPPSEPALPAAPPSAPPEPPPSSDMPSPPPAPKPTTPPPTATPKPSPTVTPNPPPPTATPTITPSPTPIPSPTPRLPSRIVTEGVTVYQNPVAVSLNAAASPPEALQQVCLQTADCSYPANSCSVITEHRVRLSQKADYKGKPNIQMYVVECLLVGGKKVCTTGDSGADNGFFGPHDGSRSNLEYLQAAPISYQLTAFKQVTASGVVPATNPITSDSAGNIGMYEWESRTPQQYERLFFVMSDVSNEFSAQGVQKSQKQGSFAFTATTQNCIVIAWDPHGKVYDRTSNLPISGAEVTLWKLSGGYYYKVGADEAVGNFANPVTTTADGSYAFRVPDGQYKISVKKEGYKYSGYDEPIFTQEGKEQIINVPMERGMSPMEYVLTMLANILH